MIRRSLRLVLLTVLLGLQITAASAQNDDIIIAQAGVRERAETIEQIAVSIPAQNADLLGLRSELRALRDAAQAARDPLIADRDRLSATIERFGPAPAEDAPPESPDVAADRERLSQAFAQVDGVARQIDLNIVEIDRLLEQIANLRTDRFFSDLGRQNISLLSREKWESGGGDLLENLQALQRDFLSWANTLFDDRGSARLLPIAIALAAAAVLILWVRRRADAMIARRFDGLEPLQSRKVLHAAARAFARQFPAFIALLAVVSAAMAGSDPSPETRQLVAKLFIAIFGVFAVDSATVACLSPNRPQWRLIDMSTSQALSLRGLLIAAAMVLGADFFLAEVAEVYGGSADRNAIVRALVGLSLAVILIVICQPALWRSDRRDSEPRADAQAAEAEPLDAGTAETGTVETGAAQPAPEATNPWRRLLFLFAIAATIAILVGYVTFGHFVTTRLFLLFALASVALFARALLREGARFVDPNFRSREARQDDEPTPVTHLIIGALANLAALAVFVPLAFLVIGADWADVRDAVFDAFFGVRVGSIEISIAQILTAVGIFVAILYATRVLQRTLDRDVFTAARVDTGVQNSLTTLIGYSGLVVAAMTGVAILGVNLSNLAIIAGALSVGIGFGLQSIVNNFVSGLILLFERPIKVGDWIVTASGEGTVRQIGVRSTQIETFDKSSVIVPNSELISGSVTNWTYKDKMGRVVIPVGVSYDADPEEVIALLEEVARDEPSLLRYPAPYIYFADFGASSLDFELRAYIWDINNILTVKTKLRLAIFHKLREAGVEIPFPQRDVHVRSGAASADVLARTSD
ncbi:MAG: DUF3772 domain-containing protein [Pseudomonadota bacterium]